MYDVIGTKDGFEKKKKNKFKGIEFVAAYKYYKSSIHIIKLLLSQIDTLIFLKLQSGYFIIDIGARNILF